MDAVAAHLTWMRERGLSETTVTTRRQVLGRLVAAVGDPVVAGRDAVEAHLAARRPGLSPGAFTAEVGHVRAFYRWAVRYEHRMDDPTGRVVTPRGGRGVADVQPIPDDVLAHVLEEAAPVDRAMLALAGLAGLRAMEVAALDWRDVNLGAGTITVHRGKGAKRRKVAISGPLRLILTALPARTGPVIPGPTGLLTPNQVSKRASRILGGRRDGYTFHQLRHRFASAAYRGTLDIRAVQDALGHSSPAVTSLYANPGAAAGIAAANAAGHLNTQETS